MNDMNQDEVTEQLNIIEESNAVDEKVMEAEIISRLKNLQFRAIREENERLRCL